MVSKHLFIFTPTLQGTNISPENGIFEDAFPFPKVGYVNSLEGNSFGKNSHFPNGQRRQHLAAAPCCKVDLRLRAVMPGEVGWMDGRLNKRLGFWRCFFGVTQYGTQFVFRDLIFRDLIFKIFELFFLNI